MATETDSTHLNYLQYALTLAQSSPTKPTNFRVGALLVSFPSSPHSEPSVLSTGYTLELSGNTHAEQCALSKLSSEANLDSILTPSANVTLYTTLEPCSIRLSGNIPCVQRIINTRTSSSSTGGIRRVIFGAKEPGTFVQDSQSCQMLTEAGVEWEYVAGLENEIMKVAKAGHVKEPEKENTGTRIDDISAEEKKRQEVMPRNPKKRMMEVPPPPGD